MISLNRAIDLLIMKNHIIAMKPDGHSACEFEEEGRKEGEEGNGTRKQRMRAIGAVRPIDTKTLRHVTAQRLSVELLVPLPRAEWAFLYE